MFSNLLHASWQGSILVIAVSGIFFIFGHRLSAQVRFLLLTIVLLRFLLPFTPPSFTSLFGLINHKTVAKTQQPINESFNIEKPFPVVRGFDNSMRETPAAVRDSNFKVAIRDVNQRQISWQQIAVIIWGIGTVCMAIPFLLGEKQLLQNRKRWQRINSPDLLRLIAECQKQAGLRFSVNVFVTTQPVGAASCGIFRPTILLSQEILKTFDMKELRLVLLHELLHHKRFDPLTHCLAQIAKILHWFNPAVWLFLIMFRSERELAADESVLSLSGRQSAALYGNSILKTFRQYGKIIPQQKSPILLGIQSQDKLLERRITMILKPIPSTLFRKFFGTLLIFGLALTGLTDAQTVQKSTETENKTEVTERSAANDDDEMVSFHLQFVDQAGQIVEKTEIYPFYNSVNKRLTEQLTTTFDHGVVKFRCHQSILSNPLELNIFALSEDWKWAAWESYYPQTWGIPDIETKIIKKTITLYPGVRTITGTVKDSNGKAVEGAYVGGGEDGQLPMFMKSKADGSFRFPYWGSTRLIQVYAIKPGVGFTYQVTEEFFEWEGKTPPDKISDGPFHLVLDKPQTVQVCVTDEKGTPIPNAVVEPASIFVSTKDAANRKDYFRPINLAPSVFFSKTDVTGIATFDWIPTTNLKSLNFTAKRQQDGVKMPDGMLKYFGESQYASWNKKDKIVTVTLPQQAKVKIKFVNTDGSPSFNVSSFLKWSSKTRPAGGESVYLNEKGEAEIPANVGDIFDLHAVGFEENQFVFPPVRNYNVGDGSEIKELTITVRKGTKVFGNVFDVDGKAVKWADQYSISGWESSNQNIAEQLSSNESFGISHTKDDATAYEIYLPPGTFTFKIRRRNEQKVKPEEQFFDEKTVTVNNEPVRLDLKLHQ
ncbi:MAG: hypothetical protein LBQ50_04295 [Planctomycetaceae bacterium]|jgi:beta-lactamase regulating signal transducer with metallopeptidase domain|nr:hypothetical protein [Planctomycetaceae bacterium]